MFETPAEIALRARVRELERELRYLKMQNFVVKDTEMVCGYPVKEMQLDEPLPMVKVANWTVSKSEEMGPCHFVVRGIARPKDDEVLNLNYYFNEMIGRNSTISLFASLHERAMRMLAEHYEVH